MKNQFTYFSKPNYRSRGEFTRMIKDAIIKEHGRIKRLKVTWEWFKRQSRYPTGLKGSCGKLTVSGEGFNSQQFILTASYMPNGDFEWRIF